MQPHMAVAHLAFEFGARHQRRDRIDDEHVDRPGAHQRVGDLERLLAGIGLRDQQIVDIDPELFGIDRVERVLGVDKGAGAAALLRLGDDVQRQRRLARAFRAVNLDDAAARQAADAERDIEPERAGRDHVDVRRGLARAELHDRALAESALDLAERRVQSPLLSIMSLSKRRNAVCMASHPILFHTEHARATRGGQDHVPGLFARQVPDAHQASAVTAVLGGPARHNPN